MFHLLYSSTSLLDRNAIGPIFALAVLLNQCLLNNPARSVTGALGFRNRRFSQLLEGPEAEVMSTFQCIVADPRHCDVETVCAGPGERRLFPGWSMAFFSQPHELEALIGGGDAWREAKDSEMVRSLVRLIA